MQIQLQDLKNMFVGKRVRITHQTNVPVIDIEGLCTDIVSYGLSDYDFVLENDRVECCVDFHGNEFVEGQLKNTFAKGLRRVEVVH